MLGVDSGALEAAPLWPVITSSLTLQVCLIVQLGEVGFLRERCYSSEVRTQQVLDRSATMAAPSSSTSRSSKLVLVTVRLVLLICPTFSLDYIIVPPFRTAAPPRRQGQSRALLGVVPGDPMEQ